jgi:hypothetical protein
MIALAKIPILPFCDLIEKLSNVEDRALEARAYMRTCCNARLFTSLRRSRTSGFRALHTTYYV